MQAEDNERRRLREAYDHAEASRKDLTARLMKAEEEAREAQSEKEKITQEAVDQAVQEYKASPTFIEEFEEAASGYFLKGAKQMMDELVDKCGFKAQWADIPLVAHIQSLPSSSPETDLSLIGEGVSDLDTSKGKTAEGKGKEGKGAAGPSEPSTGFSSDEDLPMYEVPPTPATEQPEAVFPEEDPVPLAMIATAAPPPSEGLPVDCQPPSLAEDQPPLPADDQPPPPAED